MNIISLSLFSGPGSRFESAEAGNLGGGRFYAMHLPALLRAYAACYPTWQIRIHHDGTQDLRWLAPLESHGLVKLVAMSKVMRVCAGMLRRLAPGPDHDVHAFLCRDMDSLPTPRESRLVDEWLESKATVHTIHDHPYHAGTPLMGGMIAFRDGILRNMSLRVPTGIDLGTHGSDQQVLNSVFWPKFRDQTLMHQLKSTMNEGAGITRFEAKGPMASTQAWMQGSLGEKADEAPHVGAVFTEYDGARYEGPTFDEAKIAARLQRLVDFYDDPSWEQVAPAFIQVRAKIQEAEKGRP